MDIRSANTKVRTGARKCTRVAKSKEPKPSLQSLIDLKLKELETASQQAPVIPVEDDLPSPTAVAYAVYEEHGSQGLHDFLHKESAEMRGFEKEVALLRKKVDIALKEKDNATVEIAKQNQLKVRLETLSRDLQKQNKALQDDFKTRTNDEHQRRDEITHKLRDSIDDISKKMDRQSEDNSRMAGENATLAQKLGEMKAQFQEKVVEYEKQIEAKGQEIALLQQRNAEQLRKTEESSMRAGSLEATINAHTQNEATLREQIKLYTLRLTEFRDAQGKSSEFLAQTAQQLQRLQSGMDDLAKARDDFNAKRQEVTALRDTMLNQIKDLRKHLNASEKVKLQKEGQCRVLQKERAELKK